MNDTKQPEALRLADALEDDLQQYDGLSLPRISQDVADKAAAELRRLHAQRDAMLAAIQRLSFAAMSRDNTMGDPSSLLAAKAELQAANKQAIAVIAMATKETP